MTDCARTWMVEAARVGRLSTAQTQTLREHLRSGCKTCVTEQRYVDWLGRTLREQSPNHDEVAVRRLRRSVLARAQANVVGPAFALRPTVAVLAIAVCALGLGAWDLLGRTPEIVVTPLTAAAVARRTSERGRDVVALDDGAYHLVVRRWPLDREVMVRLPDGEIEDLGTVFTVRVANRKTERVDVTRGAVALRLSGVPEIVLAAGETWEAKPAPVPELPSPIPPIVVERPASVGSSARPVEPSGDHPRSVAKHKRRGVPAPTATERAPASPASSSLEDAAYLHVLDLLREQRSVEARRAAEAYLTHFPSGFRRPEMEQLLEGDRKLR